MLNVPETPRTDERTHAVLRSGRRYVCRICPFRGDLSAGVRHAVERQFVADGRKAA